MNEGRARSRESADGLRESTLGLVRVEGEDDSRGPRGEDLRRQGSGAILGPRVLGSGPRAFTPGVRDRDQLGERRRRDERVLFSPDDEHRSVGRVAEEMAPDECRPRACLRDAFARAVARQLAPARAIELQTESAPPRNEGTAIENVSTGPRSVWTRTVGPRPAPHPSRTARLMFQLLASQSSAGRAPGARRLARKSARSPRRSGGGSAALPASGRRRGHAPSPERICIAVGRSQLSSASTRASAPRPLPHGRSARRLPRGPCDSSEPRPHGTGR